MLVLTRRVDEHIVIVDEQGKLLCTLAPIAVRGNKVRLGFVAPKEIQVHREEAWQKKEGGG